MNGRFRRLSIVAATLFPAVLATTQLLAPSAAAYSNELSCGAVVTTDVTLHADLLNCPDEALVVGADNITINLGGHTLSGTGQPGANGPNIGVLLVGHQGVTVTHGSISGFNIGVLAIGSSGNRLTHLDIEQIAGKGIILTAGSSGTDVSHNNLNRNSEGAIGIFDGSNKNVIRRNHLSADGPQGIENLFADSTTITHNMITRTGSGIILESSDSLVITRNAITHSISTACDGCGIAVQIYGNNNMVADNTLIDSPRYGIEVDDFQDPGHSPVTSNVLRDNRIVGAGEGIAIGPEAGGVVLNTLIQHNLTNNASDDGIQLIGPSTGLQTSTLADNIANHNGDLGIETVPGTIDGGGNRAAGNGNPLDCVNIICR